jgi:hypothetical protein
MRFVRGAAASAQAHRSMFALLIAVATFEPKTEQGLDEKATGILYECVPTLPRMELLFVPRQVKLSRLQYPVS